MNCGPTRSARRQWDYELDFVYKIALICYYDSELEMNTVNKDKKWVELKSVTKLHIYESLNGND